MAQKRPPTAFFFKTQHYTVVNFQIGFQKRKKRVPMAPSACPLGSYTKVVMYDHAVLGKKMASSHAPTKNLWLQNDHQQRSFSRHNTTRWSIFRLVFKTEKI